MRVLRPATALAQQRELACALDRHLVLDQAGDVQRRGARQLAERRPAVAEHPRVPVLVGSERSVRAERVEQLEERDHRVPLARELVVVRDLGHRRVRLRVLQLEARHEHAAPSVGRERERHRPLGRDEREARVVRDAMRIEEHAARAARRSELLGKRLAPRGEFLGCDRE
jgi:hypothetical protein